MAVRHGKHTEVKMDNSSGTLTDIKEHLDTSSLDRMREAIEATTFGDNDKAYVAGLRDGTFSLNGPYSKELDDILNSAFDTDETRSIEYGPGGDASGESKYTFEALITKGNSERPVGDVGSMSGEFQLTGVITRGRY